MRTTTPGRDELRLVRNASLTKHNQIRSGALFQRGPHGGGPSRNMRNPQPGRDELRLVRIASLTKHNQIRSGALFYRGPHGGGPSRIHWQKQLRYLLWSAFFCVIRARRSGCLVSSFAASGPILRSRALFWIVSLCFGAISPSPSS